MIQVRPNTQDQHVVNEVIEQNAYRLPDKISGTVIDIGGHIGCFAIACLMRGADRVVSFEPCPDNFALLKQNTKPFGEKSIAFNSPVWRSDYNEKVSFVPCGKYTACGQVTPNNGNGDKDTIGLDSIVEQHGPVSLLKIDAEGSEYPILYTSRLLANIPSVIGELHAVGTSENKVMVAGMPIEVFTREAFKFILESRGFTVAMEPERILQSTNYLFWAHRNRCIL